MGNRAAHNWKRRQKLLEKYGGKGSGKGAKGKGSKGKTGSRKKEATYRDTEKRDPSQNRKKPVKKVTKLKSGKKQSSESKLKATEEKEPGSPKRKKVRKVGSKKVIKKSKSTDKTLEGKTLKTKKLRKVLKKSFQKQTARVVCPGSLTERFVACGKATSHSPLTAFERGLLATGPLSWRWLRDQDDDVLPEKMRPVEVDHAGHHQALRQVTQQLNAKDAERLWHLDSILESDALWPSCPARVTLADRLRTPKALKRRCGRYLKEVLVPLAEFPAFGESSQALKQAHELVTSCANAWREEGMLYDKAQAASASVQGAWLQMLHWSLGDGSKVAHLQEHWRTWLLTLRQVQLARLCPCADAEMQLRLLRTIASASAGQLNSAPVVIPLGLFTFWQALLLVALARRQGQHALVVRRHASGAPEVLFRTSSLSAET